MAESEPVDDPEGVLVGVPEPERVPVAVTVPLTDVLPVTDEVGKNYCEVDGLEPEEPVDESVPACRIKRLRWRDWHILVDWQSAGRWWPNGHGEKRPPPT